MKKKLTNILWKLFPLSTNIANKKFNELYENLDKLGTEVVASFVDKETELSSHIEILKKQIELIDNELHSIEEASIKRSGKLEQGVTDAQSFAKKAHWRVHAHESNMLRMQQQPRLSYFVLNIVDHCNLKCKGCDHFAPIAEERIVPLETIQSDLNQMSLLTKGAVTRIGIMGGEPLLHPDLMQILLSARSSFPRTVIQLVSNGLLMTTQKEDFWKSCKENEINIVITKYPVNLNYEKIEEIARLNQVSLSYFGKTESEIKKSEKMPLDILGLQDPKISFFNCHRANTLPLVMEGKLFPCTAVPNIIHFNRKFSTNLELDEGDYLDIYSIKTGVELLSFLCKPKPFCRHCKTTERVTGLQWERSKQDISEWV